MAMTPIRVLKKTTEKLLVGDLSPTCFHAGWKNVLLGLSPGSKDTKPLQDLRLKYKTYMIMTVCQVRWIWRITVVRMSEMTNTRGGTDASIL